MAQDATAPVGPPQLLTAPLHAPEQLQDLILGRRAFGFSHTPFGDGDPPPAPAPGSASFEAPTQGGGGSTKTSSNTIAPYQGEPAITVTPDFMLVGGYNSIDPGNCSAALANCAPGATVADASIPSVWTTSSIPIAGNVLGFDPSIAADVQSNVYYSYGVCSGSCSTANLMVATSNRSKLLVQKLANPWTAFQVTPPKGNVFDDKPWIAADRRIPGLVYVAWDRNQGNNQTIYVTRTKNGSNGYSIANGWSTLAKVNDGTSKAERVIYAMPAVANDHPTANPPVCGTVYVVWMDYARKALFVDKSTDCGTTWGTDKKVASLNITFTALGCNGGRSMTPAPYIAVDDLDPKKVYVTYADDVGAGTGMDIYIIYSTDGGNNWSAPYTINDDGTVAHQYNPAMSVAGGKVHVSWLDRRRDPANCLTETYSTVSTSTFTASTAPTFLANAPVSPGKSDFSGNPNGPGDYTGNTSFVNGVVYGQPLFPAHLGTDVSSFDIYSAQVTP